jgi:predicted Zn finger-like uncharacterized protein
MLTQCPHCLTMFRISPEQLKAAAGKVRCSRCNQVFNALHRLEEAPETFLQKAPAGDDDYWHADADYPSTEVAEDQNWETEPSAEYGAPMQQAERDEPTLESSDSEFDLEGESDFILEQDDGLETEPEYFAADTESHMSELLDQDTTSSLLIDDEPQSEPAEVIDFLRKEEVQPQADEDAAEPHRAQELPEEEELSPGYDFGDSILKDEEIDLEKGKLDYDSVPAFRTSIDEPGMSPSTPPADESVFAFEPTRETAQRRSSAGPLWIIGSLVLLLLLGGQLVWLFKENLIQHEVGRQVVSLMCKVAGCTVPIRRDTGKIVIQSRNLSTHPDQPDVLFMQLIMANTASFEQPFPKVQLSLFNDKGMLIARRTFAPDDYLPQGERRNRMMPISQPIQVEMQLQDPGKEVTGYTFEFL